MNIEPGLNSDRQNLAGTVLVEEQSRLEFELALEEHKLANAQILYFQEANYKNYEFMVVALGASIVAGSFIVEHGAYSLLLLLSIPFYILIWLQARRAIVSNRLANYILFVSAPRLKRIVQPAGQQQKCSDPFKFTFWEEYIAYISRGNRKITITMGLSEAGRAIFQLGVAIALMVAYFLLRANDQQYVPTIIDTGLLVLNGLAIIASVYAYVMATTNYGSADGEKPQGRQ